jgi:hypothetical protein
VRCSTEGSILVSLDASGVCPVHLDGIPGS